MMINKNAALLILFLLSIVYTRGQEQNYITYRDTLHGFSFQIPGSWTITCDPSDDFFIGTCKPTLKKDIDIYADCFEGIIFRILYYNTDLITTLEEDGQYVKKGDTYYTFDRVNDDLKTENTKGENWTGIYHNNICGILCKETGPQAIGGECEYFYFSNGIKTICITTNGRKLDENIKAEILKTFRFNKSSK